MASGTAFHVVLFVFRNCYADIIFFIWGTFLDIDYDPVSDFYI